MQSAKYLEVISLTERVHRQFLELVKLKLDSLRIRNVNNVQALLLFNISDAEMTVRELTSRGCYLGSNVSYNVKKMVQSGYLQAERSADDLRSIHIKLTKKGLNLRDELGEMLSRHADLLATSGVSETDLQSVSAVLQQIERF